MSQTGWGDTMMNISLDTYTVSFFGHREIEDSLLIEQRLETLIRRLLKEKKYVELYIYFLPHFNMKHITCAVGSL